MPAGIYTNMKVYDPQVQGGFVETITQNLDVIGNASQGAITMTSDRKQGHFDIESFFQNTSGLVTRRNIASTAAVDPITLNQSQFVDVKLNRKIGPLDITEDALVKAGYDLDTMKFVGGQQAAVHVTANAVNTTLAALRGAISAQPALFSDISAVGDGAISTAALVNTMAKMGDMSGRIVCWVMHSAVFYKLVQAQITTNLSGLSDLVIATASPVTLNRPVLVTDDPALVVVEGAGSAAVNEYITMGLVPGAAEIHDSEGERIVFDRITGLENLVMRMQGEYAFSLKLKGMAWDVTNGGINPSDTAVATGSNWDSVMNSHKDLPGVILRTR